MEIRPSGSSGRKIKIEKSSNGFYVRTYAYVRRISKNRKGFYVIDLKL